uniref:Uncharacterized protein n=1 Tax=Amphimedon queenslandica TaxID=400682 RepID=A0A1X7UI43_AMPQE
SSYNYSWHTAPRRQFIVNLDASVQVTVSSGEKRILKEGEVFFVEDTTALPTLVVTRVVASRTVFMATSQTCLDVDELVDDVSDLLKESRVNNQISD